MKTKNLNGLRGWLALLGIGVVLSPFGIGITAISAFSDIYSEGAWSMLTTEGSPVYNAFFAPVIMWEIVLNTCLFTLSTYAVYLFFTKKRTFPAVYIFLLTLTVVGILIDAMLSLKILPDEPVFDEETIKILVRSSLVFAIWVPYLIRSKRVKATFIENHNSARARKWLGTSTALTATLFIAVLISDTDYNELDPSVAFWGGEVEDINSTLLAIANNTNKDLPVMVDTETRLDTTTGSNGEFTYKYTLVNLALEDIDQQYVYETMKPIITNNVCTMEDMAFFVNQNIPVKYLYFGKNGKEVTRIIVTTEDCQTDLQQPEENFI